MTTTAEPNAGARAPLTRERIVRVALDYIDAHGLGGLSMHKLGGELGVKAMSLYNHVASKHDLFDGVVELLWTEIENAAPAGSDWREGCRSFAHALRDTVHRHPSAASLIFSHGTMPTPALRCIQTHVVAARAGGVTEPSAYAVLRTITSYAFGSALNEVSWYAQDCRPDTVGELLPSDVPADLAAVAEIFCGQSDLDAQFELGLDLMLRGAAWGGVHA